MPGLACVEKITFYVLYNGLTSDMKISGPLGLPVALP